MTHATAVSCRTLMGPMRRAAAAAQVSGTTAASGWDSEGASDRLLAAVAWVTGGHVEAQAAQKGQRRMSGGHLVDCCTNKLASRRDKGEVRPYAKQGMHGAFTCVKSTWAMVHGSSVGAVGIESRCEWRWRTAWFRGEWISSHKCTRRASRFKESEQ